MTPEQIIKDFFISVKPIEERMAKGEAVAFVLTPEFIEAREKIGDDATGKIYKEIWKK